MLGGTSSVLLGVSSNGIREYTSCVKQATPLQALEGRNQFRDGGNHMYGNHGHPIDVMLDFDWCGDTLLRQIFSK